MLPKKYYFFLDYIRHFFGLLYIINFFHKKKLIVSFIWLMLSI